MLHYDGPAFYRKFIRQGAMNKTKHVRALKNKRWSRHRHQRSAFIKDTQRKTFNRFKPTHESYHVNLQNNPIARITAAFKPKKNYLSPGRYSVDSEANLNRAFNQVSDNPLAGGFQHPEPRPPHYHFASSNVDQAFRSIQTAPVSSSEQSRAVKQPVATSSTSSVRQPSRFRNPVTSQHESLESNQQTKPEQRQPLTQHPVTSRESSGTGRLNQPEQYRPMRSAKPAAVRNSVVTSSQSSLSSSSSRGPLGRNLSSIMNTGNTLVKNSPLFQNSPLQNRPQVHRPLQRRHKLRPRKIKYAHQPAASGRPRVKPSPNLQNPLTQKQHTSTQDSHHEVNQRQVTDYRFPGVGLLNAPQREDDQGLDDWILQKAEILNRTLRAFKVNAQVVDWTNGPTVTQFQVKLHLGVKVSKVRHLSDDLKMALAAKDIRIEAPIPGKTTCGIEIPNPKPRPVMLSEVVGSKAFQDSQAPLTIALGVDLSGHPRVADLSKMPHGLIAGATGSGKSVFINSLLISLLYRTTPEQLRMILIDPKAVELAPYNKIPHLLSPVISEPKQAAAALKWTVKEMDQRYDKLAAARVRNIDQFNQKAERDHHPKQKMPYILIVIDELADLMMVASDEVETYIVRITQKARAAGIHLIVATQRPSVDIVTGTIKNNIPTRVAFMVSSQVDSRTIIDTSGAERLLGKGDMLYLGSGQSHPIRLQGCFVSSREVDRVTNFVRKQEPPQYAFQPGSLLKKVNKLAKQDELMPQVLAYIAKEKTISTSKLQRVFSIGYNRAAKLIDALERHNYISGQQGSKPRDVYLTEADYKKMNF